MDWLHGDLRADRLATGTRGQPEDESPAGFELLGGMADALVPPAGAAAWPASTERAWRALES
jgi:hypothetical protein